MKADIRYCINLEETLWQLVVTLAFHGIYVAKP